MSVLPILTYGDDLLRKISKKIDNIDGKLNDFAATMVETLYVANGIGLAAPQVGLPQQMAVIDMSFFNEKQKPLAFINPEIIGFEGEQTEEEGCLSIPELREIVTRHAKIGVRYYDLAGHRYEIEADGLLSRVFQHEIDHLNGKLFIDMLSSLKRNLLQKKLKAIERNEFKKGEEPQYPIRKERGKSIDL
jgi:peptide deformylase